MPGAPSILHCDRLHKRRSKCTPSCFPHHLGSDKSLTFSACVLSSMIIICSLTQWYSHIMGLTFTTFISTMVHLLLTFIFAAFTDSLKIYLPNGRVLLLFYPKTNYTPFCSQQRKDSFWLSNNDRTFCTEFFLRCA